MCGLILAPKQYSVTAFERALDRMSYRGANNQSGLTEAFGWKLGHIRLAIQDLSDAAAQPFISSGSITAFVGELFNHGGYGEQYFLKHLLATEDFHNVDGFWSVVQVTPAGTRIFTDYLGTKPLYWWPKHNIVCSELTPMFELEPAPKLDQVYLANCIKFGYDYSGRTAFEGIRQIEPGTRLFLGNDPVETSIRQYWDWSKVPGDPDELRAILDYSISNRLIGDRPVAMLLSGGLDSSIIYYSLREQGREVHAFSVENGETEFLPEGVSTLVTDPVSLSDAVAIMQAPLDLGSLVPQIQLARAVSYQGFHVVLTGDGADELFGGYRRAAEYDSQRSDIFCELPYYHLPRLDRVMMRSTIELRSPFISPFVIAAALRTPRRDRTSKQALKRAYKGTVPRRILEREKHPLKTTAVIQGGQTYRKQLVEEFYHVSPDLRLQSECVGN